MNKNDVKEGEGTYHYSDGAIFKGFWKNDKIEGFGTLTFANG